MSLHFPVSESAQSDSALAGIALVGVAIALWIGRRGKLLGVSSAAWYRTIEKVAFLLGILLASLRYPSFGAGALIGIVYNRTLHSRLRKKPAKED